MAITINLFEQHVIDTQIAVLKEPPSYLRDTFFSDVRIHEVDSILVDIEIDGEKLAAFVSSEDNAVVVSDEGYGTRQVKTPKLLMMMDLKPSDFFNHRQPGHAGITAGSSKDFRDKVLLSLARKLRNLKNRTIRTEEWMAAQALFNGSWTVTLPQTGKKYSIDFQRPAAHDVTLTGNDLWTDYVNADPLKMIDDKSALITKAVGIQPNYVIMSKTDKQHFMSCAKVQAALDNRRINRGNIDTTQEEMAAGVKKFAEIDNFSFYEYDKTYVDYNGAVQPFVPDGKVLITGKTNSNRRHYGPIEDFDAMPDVARSSFSKNWLQKMPSKWLLSLESHPLLAMHQPEAAVVLTVR